MPAPTDHPPYLLSNAAVQAEVRLRALATLFDPGTIRHLEGCGVEPGWRCLEVGGGAGTIAAWLADRVGPAGHVLVTDIDARFLQGLAASNLEVRRHDIAADPLPPAAFDLVHVRLVLNQFADPGPILARLRGSLKPGGWLLCEEFDSASMPADPDAHPGETLLRSQVVLARVMAARGFDRRFGRRLFAHLRAQGFADVAAEGRVFMVPGGTAGAALVHANCAQLRPALVDTGDVTDAEIERDLASLDDPALLMPSSVMWAAWGRRAEGLEG